jgi:hypothetical protein
MTIVFELLPDDSGRFARRLSKPQPPIRRLMTRASGGRIARSYPQGQKEANLPLIFSAPLGHVAVAGIGGARSVAMSRRMSPNRWREMATSAIWNAM